MPVGSDTDELGLQSKARPVTAQPLNSVTQTRDGFADSNALLPSWLRFSNYLCAWLGGGLGHYSGRLSKSLERFAAAPHAVQDDGQFAGHGDEGSFLTPFASTGSQLEAPTTQCRVGTEAAQDILGPLHQQTAQVGVAGFRDASLGVGLARLALPRTKTEERPRLAVVA